MRGEQGLGDLQGIADSRGEYPRYTPGGETLLRLQRFVGMGFLHRVDRTLQGLERQELMPFVGATFKQFAPLHLNRPRNPSVANKDRSSASKGRPAVVEHMFTVATTSSGDTTVRDTTPATAYINT